METPAIIFEEICKLKKISQKFGGIFSRVKKKMVEKTVRMKKAILL